MKLQEVIREKRKKSIVISIRISPEVSQWMTKFDVMPSKIFNKSIQELMAQTKTESKK